MTLLLAILALSVLIIVHEAGHYVCAKLGGMHVDVFSVVGIGPVVLELFTWRGTKFVISAIPFGAYVHIVGMEPDEEPASEEEKQAAEEAARHAAEMGYANYRDRPIWARALALFGGPLANYVAAFVLALGVFVSSGVPNAASIAGFQTASPARAACLREGDVFVSIAGTAVQGDNPRGRVIQATSAHLGENVDVVVQRGTKTVATSVALNPQPPALGTDLREELDATASFATAVSAAVRFPIDNTAVQLAGLATLVTGKSKGRVGGPVAIVNAMKSSADHGVRSFILFSALISTLLGMFNLLPLPALDGGRLVFLGWEAVVRRPVSAVVEAWVHSTGLLALLLFIAYATIGDVRGEPFSIFNAAKDHHALILAERQATAAASACHDTPEA